MNLRLITAPASEPVAVATVKAFLRVDDSNEDALITSLAKAAREKGEELARRAFITQTWEQTIDCWPVDLRLKLYRPPLISVSSVKYLDSDNVEHTFTDYVVDTRNEPGVIIFNSVPGAALLESGAITVRFIAGFGADTAVPERIKNLILALTARWYENRESHDVPTDIKWAFMEERAVWL
jgi:uncharacterized phiE125 gp8 family phage protein